MNREIKFRAWDNENKRMFNDCFELTKTGFKEWVQLRQASEDLEWMQFTGLKDKNGKEMYEGDIITWGSKVENHTIIFEDGCYLYEREFSMGGELDSASIKNNGLEVIGNIHEQPELL